MVKVRPLCRRSSANVVEEGVPDSDLIVLKVGVVLGRPEIPPIFSGGILLIASGLRHRPPGIQPGCLRPFDAERFTF